MKVRTAYEILNPEGHRVHTSKSKSDAFRIADRFNAADGVRHTVHLITLRQERQQ